MKKQYQDVLKELKRRIKSKEYDTYFICLIIEKMFGEDSLIRIHFKHQLHLRFENYFAPFPSYEKTKRINLLEDIINSLPDEKTV